MTTLGELIADSDLPRREAELILQTALGLSRVTVLLHPEKPVTEADCERVRTLFSLRREGVPFPYLCGKQEFFSREFTVTPDTLIPRPDTECLVEWCLANIADGARVADLGTGSGCIAVTLALENPTLSVAASDISLKALHVAKENALRLGASVSFFEGSWLAAFPKDFALDAIVSNPPYIHCADKHLKALSHEPLTALTDGSDGLSCIRAILTESRTRLLSHPIRLLAIEHGWDQGAIVRRLFEEHGFSDPHTHKDYGGNDRFTTWCAA